MRTTTIKLDGNTFAAKSLADMEVNRLLEIFRKQTSFQNLQQNKQRVNLVGGPFDGAHVTLTTQFGIETVEIFVPPRAVPPLGGEMPVEAQKRARRAASEERIAQYELPALYGCTKNGNTVVAYGWIVFLSGRIDSEAFIFVPTTDHPEQFVPGEPVRLGGGPSVGIIEGQTVSFTYSKTPDPYVIELEYQSPIEIAYPSVSNTGEAYWAYWNDSDYAIPVGCWVRGMSQWATDSWDFTEVSETIKLVSIPPRELQSITPAQTPYSYGFDFAEEIFVDFPTSSVALDSSTSSSGTANHIGVGGNPSGGCSISGVAMGVIHPDDPDGCYDGGGCREGAARMLQYLATGSSNHTLEEIGKAYTWNENDLQWGWDGSYFRSTTYEYVYASANVLFLDEDNRLSGGFGHERRYPSEPNTFTYSSWLAPKQVSATDSIDRYETYATSSTGGAQMYDYSLAIVLKGDHTVIEEQTFSSGAEAFSAARTYSYTYYVHSHATSRMALMCAGHYPVTKYSGDAFQWDGRGEVITRAYSRTEAIGKFEGNDLYIYDYGGGAFPTVIQTSLLRFVSEKMEV